MATLFTVTGHHLQLLAAMADGVHWNKHGGRHGAPALDAKRPYGFSYDLFGNIASVVDPEGWAAACADDSTRIEYEETHRRAYLELHYATATVLGIMLACGEAHPGVYERTEHGWLIREAHGHDDYLSTGCRHGNCGHCRSNTAANGDTKEPGTCKFCGARCRCKCHPWNQPATP